MESSVLQQDIAKLTESFPFVEEFKGKTFIVTGATGLIGSIVVKTLLALNKCFHLSLRVVAVIRNDQKAKEVLGEETDDLVFWKYDFSSGKPFDCISADYLIHLAAPTASRFFVEHPAETMNIVYDGTRSVLDFAKENHLSSVVYVSSLEAFGVVENDDTPLTESMQGYINPTDVRSSYPMAKRTSECLCHAYAEEFSLPVKVARLAQTFGAGVSKDDMRVFAQFARCIINGKNIELNTAGMLSRCYCYTTDAVMALFYILVEGQSGGIYNVANPATYISIKDMAQKLCDDFAPSLQLVFHIKEGQGYSPTTHIKMSTERLEALGWRPRYSLRQMFERLIASLKEKQGGDRLC